MGQFYSHGRGTGGGSPLYPPDDQEDDSNTDFWSWDDGADTGSNFIPVSLPDHLSVMPPPTDVNLDIVRGPPPLTTNGMKS